MISKAIKNTDDIAVTGGDMAASDLIDFA